MKTTRRLRRVLATCLLAAATAWAYVHFRVPIRPDFEFDPSRPFTLQISERSFIPETFFREISIASTGTMFCQSGVDDSNRKDPAPGRSSLPISEDKVRAVADAIVRHRFTNFRNHDDRGVGATMILVLRQGPQPPVAVAYSVRTPDEADAFRDDLRTIFAQDNPWTQPRQPISYAELMASWKSVQALVPDEEREKTARLRNLMVLASAVGIGLTVSMMVLRLTTDRTLP